MLWVLTEVTGVAEREDDALVVSENLVPLSEDKYVDTRLSQYQPSDASLDLLGNILEGVGSNALVVETQS